MAEYDVRYPEVQGLHSTYDLFQSEIEKKLKSINEATREFVELESFQGEGGNAARGYFRVHLYLTEALSSLANQLATDYARAYYSKFAEDPVFERDAEARWFHEKINLAEKKLSDLAKGNVAEAAADLRTAIGYVPAGVHFTAPSSEALSAGLIDWSAKTKKVRDGVGLIEGSAKALFSNTTGEYEQLAMAISKLISGCSQGIIAPYNYSDAAFSQLMQTAGLSVAYSRASANQTQHRAVLVESRKDCLEKEQVRVERQLAEAEKKKKTLAVLGFVASIAVCAAGAAAFVATAGAATPVLFALKATIAGAGLVGSISDMTQRADQLIEMYSGNVGADRSEAASSVFKDPVMDGAGAIKAGLEVDYELKKHDYAEAISSIDDFGEGVMKDLVEDSIDKGLASATTEEGKMLIDVTTDLGSELIDQVDDFKGSGLLGVTGKCVTKITDYYADEADEEIERLEARQRALDDLDPERNEMQDFDWGTRW